MIHLCYNFNLYNCYFLFWKGVFSYYYSVTPTNAIRYMVMRIGRQGPIAASAAVAMVIKTFPNLKSIIKGGTCGVHLPEGELTYPGVHLGDVLVQHQKSSRAIHYGFSYKYNSSTTPRRA